MGVDLILEKGEHKIEFGRAYHFEEDEDELKQLINDLRIDIILACFRNRDEGEISVTELFEELETYAGKLAMRRHINGLKQEGYKEVKG